MKNFEILTLELKNITPTIIGGYRATTFSPSLGIAERFRVSELKGIWRWWFRALAAGALWDAHGCVEENRVREKVRAVLGSTNSASKFILQAHVRKEGKPKLLSCKGNLPSRLKLLCMMGRERKEKEQENGIYYYDVGDLEYNLRLLKQPGMELREDELRVGVSSLLMAIIFQGVGAITRRGFGAWSLRVNRNNVGKEYADKLESYIQVIDKLNEIKSSKDAANVIDKLIHLASDDFSKFIGISEGGGMSDDIPPCPIVSRNRNIFRISIEDVKASSPMDLLIKIGNATMKATWRRHLHRPSNEIHTWILGLPRGQKKGMHGYAVNYNRRMSIFDLGRRPSAISIHPLKRLSDDGWICIVYGFLSKDWPKTLYHISLKRDKRFRGRRGEHEMREIEEKVISISDNLIRDIFKNAFDMVIACLHH